MKILFLSRRFYPEMGGVEKHVLEISKRLIKKGHQVVVITENSLKTQNDNKQLKSASAKLTGEAFGIRIVRINPGENDWFKKFRVWGNLWELRNLISDADIIHCHDVFYWYLPFKLLFPHKKVFTTFHGYEGYPIKTKAVIIRKVSETLSKGNICVGKFIEKYYKTKADFVVYGGVNIPKRFEKYKNEFSAVFIGRITESTGINLYNKVFQILKNRFQFKLTVVGEGDLSLLNKNVLVEGEKVNVEKYFSINHFAFVSGYLSILEAMANKRLVFAVYDNKLKEDYLKMTPFKDLIIIEDNPGAIAEKAVNFLNNPELEKTLTDKAFNWVKKQTWDSIVETYLKLWSLK